MSVDLIAATENVSAIKVVIRIVLSAINGMPVISKDGGRLIGVGTIIDIVHAIRGSGDLTRIMVKDLMSSEPVSIKEET